MSGTVDRLASQLAEDTLKAMRITGDDRLFVEVGQLLGASSQTLEEAFLTEIRVRMAADKARAFLDQKVRAGG